MAWRACNFEMASDQLPPLWHLWIFLWLAFQEVVSYLLLAAVEMASAAVDISTPPLLASERRTPLISATNGFTTAGLVVRQAPYRK